jgi:putative tryptophan/tyrosine transport system substrate-binding protein
MKRREFIALIGGAVAWPFTARGQQAAAPVIGFLTTSKPYPPLMNELRSGLAETGYHEGQNVSVEYAWADGHYDRLPALAADSSMDQLWRCPGAT